MPTPQVAGGHLSQTPCPRVPNASLIMIFLPRINLFYIMVHAVGASPQPFMRIPWLGCTQVCTCAPMGTPPTAVSVHVPPQCVHAEMVPPAGSEAASDQLRS